MISQVPQNWWQQNQFMMPQLQGQGFRPPPGLIDLAPQTDQSGILSTSGMPTPDYITEGKSGAEKGQGGVGNSFSYGAPEYGLEAGKSADATNTTTGSHSWGDVLGMALTNAVPGIGTLLSVTGVTQTAKDLAREYAQAMGLMAQPQQAQTAPTDNTQPSDPYSGSPNPVGGNDTDYGPAAPEGTGLAGNTGDASSESPGLYAKGGAVQAQALMGGDPPGPDTGYGGLMGGEFVVNAKQAKKHRGILDAINSGASKAKLRGILG